MFKPDLRQEYEFYISQQATIAGYKTLIQSNLQKSSHLTVANLYSYFKTRDESDNDVEVAPDLNPQPIKAGTIMVADLPSMQSHEETLLD